MNKITFIGLLLVLPFFGFSQELITNGDLETGALTPFTSVGTGATISVNTGDKYAGSYSLNMANDSGKFKQDITTVIGQTYRLSFYFK